MRICSNGSGTFHGNSRATNVLATSASSRTRTIVIADINPPWVSFLLAPENTEESRALRWTSVGQREGRGRPAVSRRRETGHSRIAPRAGVGARRGRLTAGSPE
ncbi:hypothetical protein D3C78_1406280 [compost metagenome]